MENEVKVTVKARDQAVELTGDTALCLTIKGLRYDKEAGGIKLDASVSFFGKTVPNEIKADVWAELFAKAVEQMTKSDLMAMITILEIAERLEKREDEVAAKRMGGLHKRGLGK